MSGAVKVFELRLDAGNGGFDYAKFDVPGVDGLFYVVGYIAAAALRHPRPGTVEEGHLADLFAEEPSLEVGFNHGLRVKNGERKPEWHTNEIDILVTFIQCGVLKLQFLVEIFHDRAKDAGKHDCSKHAKREEQYTSKQVLKA